MLSPTHRTAPPSHPHTSNVSQLLLPRRPPAPVHLPIAADLPAADLPIAAEAASLPPPAAATVLSRRRRRVRTLRMATAAGADAACAGAGAACAGAGAACAKPVASAGAWHRRQGWPEQFPRRRRRWRAPGRQAWTRADWRGGSTFPSVTKRKRRRRRTRLMAMVE